MNNRFLVILIIGAFLIGVLIGGFSPFVRNLISIPTHTPNPTYTPYPTHTPNPTYTLPPTATATDTPTNTPTPTVTNTPTPLPTYTLRPTYTPLPTYTPFPTATPTATPTLTPTVNPRRIILNSLIPLRQLDVISAEASQEVITSINNGILNLCGYNANHASYGVIEAGIDFSTIDEDSIIYDTASDSITLILPPPVITSCRIEYIDQYDGSHSLCGTDWDTLRQLAQHDIMSGFVKDTKEREFLARAKSQASLFMRSFVSDLTGKLVDIEYEASDTEAELPPSCVIEIPSGWTKDAESGAWVKTD